MIGVVRPIEDNCCFVNIKQSRDPDLDPDLDLDLDLDLDHDFDPVVKHQFDRVANLIDLARRVRLGNPGEDDWCKYFLCARE